ncbi:MAG: hypothetical protein IPN95_26690 [Bacteroidetes bacterium]|nr:hypothetical protein [Bacteroidota bacterium]
MQQRLLSALRFPAFLVVLILLASACHRPQTHSTETRTTATPAIATAPTANAPQATYFRSGSPVTSILQDRAGSYWIGTDRDGLFRFDGKFLVQWQEKDGLCNNQIRKIQEDQAGNIWVGTANGVSRFDGQAFTTFPIANDATMAGNLDKEWKLAAGDLWFPVGAGLYRYHPTMPMMAEPASFSYLPLPSTAQRINDSESASSPMSPFTVYSSLTDKSGNLWIGTQSLGVCRYDGKSFTWLSELGLAGPAVLALFEDNAGNMWFGNNGAGIFRFDGKTLTNLTAEKGLGNPEFMKGTGVSIMSNPGTMARIYSIAEDKDGNIWFGTIDAGVWRWDGTTLTNFTQQHGLDSDAIEVIYLDQKGNLLFGTDGGGVFVFDGNGFLPFELR